MHHRSLLFSQLIVVAFVAAIHLFGIEYHLYWRFIWLDTLTHALGGMWVGLLFFWGRALFGYLPSVAWSILGAILVGVFWEAFELYAGIPREANWAFDTSIDLLMDSVGGALGAFLAHYLIRRKVAPEAML